MIVIWGKLAGIGLGVFGGPIGAVFGLFIGHALDVIAAQFMLRRAIGRTAFSPASRKPRWLNEKAAIAALAVIATADPRWRPEERDIRVFTNEVEAWSPTPARHPVLRRIAIGPAMANRYLDAAVAMDLSSRSERLAERIVLLPTEEDRKRVIEVCRATLGTEAGARATARMHSLAHLCGLPDEWIDENLGRRSDPAAGIDQEDLRILGIEPGASLDEVKRAYRKLAAQFHPDATVGLSSDQREASSAAFVKIRSAYDRVVEKLQHNS